MDYSTASAPTPAPQPMTEGEEQGWGVGLHLGGFIAWFIAPLVLWLVFRSRSRMLDDHGRTTLNWHLTLIIIALPLGVLAVALSFIDPLWFLVMWLVMVLLMILSIIFAIRGAIAAFNRRPYRYPLSIPFFTR
ncbi:DUF4870 domain-containing protein [Nesterenkonia aurantiaca]|uniref:Tic20 family protein n=1 Tax=Nesterenkonia aurantiaca TaxID=1436010 RepID=A0A4R7FV65_9MICC|nr:DUF4870 domain-containing protein [Nesterenkonia aurantiaca]TDS82649.1 hypothetical protein EV640_11422 [Nesterenkonia aurantiaca]